MLSQPQLRRALGFWPAVSIIIGTTIGSGIFLVPSDMANAVGTPGLIFFVWIFGGLLSLFGALTYAELSAALPDAGGEYAYLNAAYGQFFGFVYGWTQSLVGKPASLATLATGFYTYLAYFVPGLISPVFTLPLPIGPGGMPFEVRWGQVMAIVLILGLSGINYVGVRLGGRVQVATTALKLVLIAGVIAAGLFSGHADSANLTTTTPALGGVEGFFAALVAALWAYDGWNNAGMLGSEIENPQRNFPRALIGGTIALIGIYLVTNLAYFLVLSASEVAASQTVAADMMRRVGGEQGAAAVSIAAMISIFAALNGSILSGSRVPYAMARDRLFFSSVARVHPKFNTPCSSIVFLGVWASIILLSGWYRQLYTLVVFTSWILYGMTAASVLVLRRTRPALERPYRTWGYPWVPVVFVFVAAALLFSTFRTSPRESGIGLVLIAMGLPFYFHWKRGQNPTSTGPVAGPEGPHGKV